MLSIIPQPMEAQFFKKIGNMLEAVDKALGGDTSKNNTATENAETDSPQVNRTVNGIGYIV